MGDKFFGSSTTELASGSLEEDDIDILDIDFLQRFDSEDISALRRFFFDEKSDKRLKSHLDKSRAHGRQVANTGGKPLDKNQFISAVEAVVGGSACSLAASRLFHQLDVADTGVIHWEEVLDHVITSTAEHGDHLWLPLDTTVLLASTPHCRRETIVKVVAVETDTSFCYTLVSKYGRVGVYDGHFDLQDRYHLHLASGEPDLDVNGEPRRRVTSTWVTDAVHLADASALVFASSDRALHLFDCSGLVHVALCHVAALKNVPQCMAYSPGTQSLLFIGDDKGCITNLTFMQPRVSLFRKKHPDKLDKYYWMELESQGDWVRTRVDSHVHRDAVRQLAYFPDNGTLVSCSQDPTTTLVIRHVGGKRAPYIFRLARGIRCFHLERTMRLVATGSNDSVVRLWNPVVTNQPTVSLFGHKSAIVDVLVLRHLSAVLSCSRDGVIKVWDVDDLCCLQTLSLNFPSFSVLGKRIEFGTRSIYPGPASGKPVSTPNTKVAPPPLSLPPTPRSSATHTEDNRDNPSEPSENVWTRGRVLVACCNHVAVLRLRARSRDVEGWRTPSPLPPPTREQRESVPSPWETSDTTPSSKSTPLSSPRTLNIASSDGVNDDGRRSPGRSRRGSYVEEFPRPPSQASRASKMSEALPDREHKKRRPVRPSEGLNARRVHHQRLIEQAHSLVEQCAPHLALHLRDLEAIRFSRALPPTTRMRERGVDVTDPERLLKARFGGSSSLSVSGSGSVASEAVSGRSAQSVEGRKTTSQARSRASSTARREKGIDNLLD